MFKKVALGIVFVFAGIGFFLVAGYFAVRFGFTNESGIIDTQREAFFEGIAPEAIEPSYTGPWEGSEEWLVMEDAIRRDVSVIQRAAADSGVPARLIVANLVAEQLRLFFTEREAYKKFFYPLKILGPQSQFSWGVMGMKEDTAIQVENNLKDTTSPYYLGPEYEHLLDFKTDDVKGERFTRMTDQHDHYWSYLYAGLFLKQIQVQWENAGYPINNRPEILSTLYNIGYRYSVPKENPQVGGAAITLSDGTRSFGGLAAEFYNSNLLTDLFAQ
ncbi:hypothetical protein KKH15_01035 [Patescibacteria group bacterium]|nr:hypothetical protein [Patescibacteria group bacterium]MBU1754735.1 hypothetical protein [Patescibacteria group bacterium]